MNIDHRTLVDLIINEGVYKNSFYKNSFQIFQAYSQLELSDMELSKVHEGIYIPEKKKPSLFSGIRIFGFINASRLELHSESYPFIGLEICEHSWHILVSDPYLYVRWCSFGCWSTRMAPFLLLHRWSSITSSPLFTNVFPKLSPLRANGFLLPKDGVFPVRLFAFPNSNRSSIQRILDGRRIGTPFICFHDARENSQPSSPQKVLFCSSFSFLFLWMVDLYSVFFHLLTVNVSGIYWLCCMSLFKLQM